MQQEKINLWAKKRRKFTFNHLYKEFQATKSAQFNQFTIKASQIFFASPPPFARSPTRSFSPISGRLQRSPSADRKKSAPPSFPSTTRFVGALRSPNRRDGGESVDGETLLALVRSTRVPPFSTDSTPGSAPARFAQRLNAYSKSGSSPGITIRVSKPGLSSAKSITRPPRGRSP